MRSAATLRRGVVCSARHTQVTTMPLCHARSTATLQPPPQLQQQQQLRQIHGAAQRMYCSCWACRGCRPYRSNQCRPTTAVVVSWQLERATSDVVVVVHGRSAAPHPPPDSPSASQRRHLFTRRISTPTVHLVTASFSHLSIQGWRRHSRQKFDMQPAWSACTGSGGGGIVLSGKRHLRLASRTDS